ncbi:MAG: NINE protein [Saprospiraceae bacterium]|nr:NINE protein [Saprospiraceae bacterium]
MTSRKYQPRRSRVTAGILALTLGAFGVQKFYLRQNGIGIFMIMVLIMTQMKVLPFLAIFGIIEGAMLLQMSDQEFDRKYNRYASRNRRDDYLEQRRERQIQKSRGKVGRRSNSEQRRAISKSRKPIAKANPFKTSGIRKYKDYDLEGAIEDFSRGLDINQHDVALHFNIACAYSMTEQKDKAYYHLAKAVELGFKDYELINSKDDLAFVRIQPEFDEFKENGYTLGVRSKESPSAKAEQKDENLVITDDVLLSQLNKLDELRKKGLLSKEEFNLERKKLLRR